MPAQAYLGYGASITIGSMTPARVKNISFSGFTLNTVDTTQLTSTWREFLVSLPDPGELTFTIQFDPADVTHQGIFNLISNSTPQDCVLALRGGQSLTFSALLSKFGITGLEPDGVQSAEVTMKISGSVTLGPTPTGP